MNDYKAIKYFLLIFLISTLIFLFRFKITGFGIYGDGVGYYVYLRSIIFDRDLDFFNEFRYYKISVSKLSGQTREIISPDKPKLTPKGYLFNPFPIGSSIMWLPFFLLGHLLAVSKDGYSVPYEMAVGIGSMIYGLLGMMIVYKILRRFFSSSISFMNTSAILLSTAAFYYFAFEPVRSHLPSFFLVSLFIYVWLKTLNRRTAWQWASMGLLMGLMVMVRTQELTFASLIVVESLFKLRFDKPNYYNLLIFTAGFLVAYLPQLIVQYVMWGDVFTSPYILSAGKPRFFWFKPELLKVLFSTNHGLFLWFPLTLVALIGFLRWKIKRVIWWPLLINFLIQYYLLASYEEWWQSAGFGARMFISSNPFFSLGLASLISKLKKRLSLKIISVILSVFIIWNFLLLGQFVLKMIPNDREFNFLVFIENQFLLPFKVIDLIIARWLHG